MSQLTIENKAAEIRGSEEFPEPKEKSRSLGSLLRFGQLTGLSFLLNLSITITLYELLRMPASWAYAIGMAVVFLTNFMVMRFYVFPAKADQSLPVLKQATGFLGSSLVFRSLEYAVFFFFHVNCGAHYVATILLVSVVSFIVKFLFYQRWFFAGSLKESNCV